MKDAETGSIWMYLQVFSNPSPVPLHTYESLIWSGFRLNSGQRPRPRVEIDPIWKRDAGDFLYISKTVSMLSYLREGLYQFDKKTRISVFQARRMPTSLQLSRCISKCGKFTVLCCCHVHLVVVRSGISTLKLKVCFFALYEKFHFGSKGPKVIVSAKNRRSPKGSKQPIAVSASL